MSIRAKLQTPISHDEDPVTQAHALCAFWHAQWGRCERPSDLPLEPHLLSPWAEHLAIFEIVNRGTDFRLQHIGRNLAAFFGIDRVGLSLSEFSRAYRQRLRQVLLRAAMIQAPAAEHYNWLVDGCVRSCLVCGMPVAGGFYQPSQLLLGIFYRTLSLDQDAASEVIDPPTPRFLLSITRARPQPRPYREAIDHV